MFALHQVPVVVPSGIAFNEVKTLLGSENTPPFLLPTINAVTTWGRNGVPLIPLVTPHLFNESSEVRLESARALAFLSQYSTAAAIPLYVSSFRTPLEERAEFRERIKPQIPQEIITSFNRHHFHLEREVDAYLPDIRVLTNERRIDSVDWPIRHIVIGIGRSTNIHIVEDCISALSNIAPYLGERDSLLVQSAMIGELFGPRTATSNFGNDFLKILESLRGGFADLGASLTRLPTYQEYQKTKSLLVFPISF